MITLDIVKNNNMFLNCRGSLLDLQSPRIMAILNFTPDSFYDGQTELSNKAAEVRILKICGEEPDIIDIGGMSSRPGAEIVDGVTEWGRIEHAIKFIRKTFPNQLVSIDTINSNVAKKALELGVQIINDISAGHHDPNMMKTVAKYKAAYVMMHMISSPDKMQDYTEYPKGLGVEILAYFKDRLQIAKEEGIEEIILDLGFGFSKTLAQNYQLMNMIHTFRIFSCPILTGISRKSMIYKLLETSPQEALNGTSALHMKALIEGSKILRVHDIKEAKEVVKIFNALSPSDY